jgi:hypothetical protein
MLTEGETRTLSGIILVFAQKHCHMYTGKILEMVSNPQLYPITRTAYVNITVQCEMSEHNLTLLKKWKK